MTGIVITAEDKKKKKKCTWKNCCFQETSFEASTGLVMLVFLQKIPFLYLPLAKFNSLFKSTFHAISVKSFFILERMTHSVCIVAKHFYTHIFLLLAPKYFLQVPLYLYIVNSTTPGHHHLLLVVLRSFSLWLFIIRLLLPIHFPHNSQNDLANTEISSVASVALRWGSTFLILHPIFLDGLAHITSLIS